MINFVLNEHWRYRICAAGATANYNSLDILAYRRTHYVQATFNRWHDDLSETLRIVHFTRRFA